jgi:phenylpropionate dioxygenase-like ring-hydroxylating dioxygenase large terminal subunit
VPKSINSTIFPFFQEYMSVMFEMFSNFWTPVLPATEVASAPVAIELAGQSLVLFRNSAGKVAALLDRCPHRGVALSLGQVTEDGCLECPYHGWHFATDGACTHVPLNNLNPSQLSKLSVVSFATREFAGLVWVFTGTGEIEEPQLPQSLLEPSENYIIYHEIWNAHWTRVIENSLDYVHVPFVHRNSFGRPLGDVVQTDAIAEVNIKSFANGMTVTNKINTLPSGIEFDWHQPNCVAIKFDLAGIPLRSHVFAIPLNERQTRFTLVILPNLYIDRTTFDFNEFITPAFEDRAIIESQIGEAPDTTEECSITTDVASLRFRRWYHSTMKNHYTKIINDVI